MPTNMEIIRLSPDGAAEFAALIEIFSEVFEEEHPLPDLHYLGSLLAHEDFVVFVVKINGSVVGGLTIYLLPGYVATSKTAYIYDVGVSPLFQRRGLGKALMETVISYCKQQGINQAYVEAAAEDKEAISFYRRTAFSSESNAVHFTYHL